MASRLQDVILRGLDADRPPANTVAPGTLYYNHDFGSIFRSDGSVWESYSAEVSGTVPAHGSSHTAGGDDEISVLGLGGFSTIPTEFLSGDATFKPIPTAPTAIHASTHISGGTDPVTVTALAGFPGGSTTFLRGDATFAALPAAAARIASIGLIIDGGVSVISVGLKGYLEVPFACTIQAVTLLADVSGSIVIDIWKDTYAAYPPVVGDSIVAAAKPTISGAVKSQDVTLTGWNTAIVVGDILAFNVDSVATIKKVTLSLKVQVP